MAEKCGKYRISFQNIELSFLDCSFNAVFNDLLIWFVGDFLVELFSVNLFLIHKIAKLFKTDSSKVDFS